MATTIGFASRCFGLEPPGDLRLPFQHLFWQFITVVNVMVKGGLPMDADKFESNGLVAAKRFYMDVVKLQPVKDAIDSVDLKERACRCAAQFAYFMIQGHKNRSLIISAMAGLLLAEKDVYCLFNKSFPSSSLLEDVKANLGAAGAGTEINSRVFIKNCFWQLRNILWQELLALHGPGIVGELARYIGRMQAKLVTTLSMEMVESLGYLGKKFLQSFSRALTARFKRVQLNKGPSRGDGKLDALLFAIYEGRFIPGEDECLVDPLLLDPSTKLSRKRWNKMRKRWRDAWKAILDGFTRGIGNADCYSLAGNGKDKDVKNIIQAAWKSVTATLTPERVIKYLLKPRKRHFPRCRFTGSPLECFNTWLESVARQEVERELVASMKPFIEQECRPILEQLEKAPWKQLKRPTFTKHSIPLGMDDGQVYSISMETSKTSGSLEGVSVNLSFFSSPKMKKMVNKTAFYKEMEGQGFDLGKLTFQLRGVDRFQEMIDAGFLPARGTLSLQHGGKLILTIPFKPRPVPRGWKLYKECIDDFISSSHERAVSSIIDAGDAGLDTVNMNVKGPLDIKQELVNALDRKGRAKVGSVDLGLITLATMSIGEYTKVNGRWQQANPHHVELNRYFIDQAQLAGNRHDWLLPLEMLGEGKRKSKDYFNFKRRLLHLLHEAWDLRSMIDVFKNEHPKDYKYHARYRQLKVRLARTWDKIDSLHDEIAKQVATRIVAACEFNDVTVLRFEDLSWSKHSRTI